jgi:(1->4)-alpha-D-glucan 1-alpha-D-glucosylmutase
LYQTLVGSWPLEPMDAAEEAEYTARIVGYMQKAMREAKVYTSWINPSEPHELAMAHFVEQVLSPENAAFRADFLEFQRRVAQYGIYNSLAQLAIKIAAPGVPDFYQGTELWDFSLVDPDNRRPVDYDRRRALLADLDAQMTADGCLACVQRLMASPRDDRLKLYATTMMLRFRRAHRELFERGAYTAVQADGARHEHLFAFLRRDGRQQALLVVPRLVTTLAPDPDTPPLGERVWGDTRLTIPLEHPACYHDIFTGACVNALEEGGRATLRASEVFEHFPVALLEGRVD